MAVGIGRRQFISALGGATAVVWPLAARAQQGGAVRRIGVLIPLAPDDPVGQAQLGALRQGLQEVGWTIGHDMQVEIRWNVRDPDSVRKSAAELLALAPDVIVSVGSEQLGPLLQITRTIPIVFVVVSDPVGAGFVESLARPGGNATGFSQPEYGTSTKLLELLKEIAPGVTRAAVLRDSTTPNGIGQFGAIQAMAPSLGVEVIAVNARDTGETERAVTAVARSSNSGLIVPSGAPMVVHRDLIITLAARYKLPAVYFERFFVAAGGLISYGPKILDEFQRAAGYVDRILKGEKPGDLPVQAPTKYELVVNLKTAKAIGLAIPPAVLARADEVIE
jgi:putative tryptophan/tyrosine transport system substrate-binding protein